MPLRLKSLELQGYKTFASRTLFEFSEGITAIVGPNGSGKSNIADALRWVLGEQSYLLLRGKKTEDMIFHGSESRPRSGMGSATIVFDNTDGWLPLEFTEVAVARRAYRDGRNEYLLNNQHLRLRDLNELLAQSGLSERTYTILGQGMVDASLALKSEDRRRLFEEAAGIGLFRSRREEALRRLESTKRNLERVLDILAELEPRLKSLERQARRAQEYRQVQADLRLLLLDWYGFHWHAAQKEFAQVRSSAQTQEGRLTEARNDFQKFLQDVQISQQRITALRREIAAWDDRIKQITAEREDAGRRQAVSKERQHALTENRERASEEKARLDDELQLQAERLADAIRDADRLAVDLAEAVASEGSARQAFLLRQTERSSVEGQLQSERQKLNSMTAEKTRQEASLEELRRRFTALRQRLETLQTSIGESDTLVRQAVLKQVEARSILQQAERQVDSAEKKLVSTRASRERIEAQRRSMLDERSAVAAEQARQAAQFEVLEQAERSLTGLAEGTRALLEAMHKGALEGAQGALSSLLDVPAEVEVAIAAALGDRMEAVLLSGGDSVESALELLEADSAGRASLLPLDWLASSKPLSPPADSACLGVASSLITAPESVSDAVRMLLGQTLIVQDRKSARRLLKETGAERVVTLRGEVFRADGLVVAGKEHRSATLGRLREKRQLQASLADLDTKLATLDNSLEDLEREYRRAEDASRVAEALSVEASSSLEASRSAEQKAGLAVESARRQAEWQAAQVEDLRREMTEAQEQGRLVAQTIQQSEAAHVLAQESIRAVNARLAELDLQEFTEQVTIWNTRAQVVENALSQAQKRVDERRQAIERLEGQGRALENRITELDQSIKDLQTQQVDLAAQAAESDSILTDLHTKKEPAEAELQSVEQRVSSLQEQETIAQRALQALERETSQAQILLARKQEAVENLRRRIVDDFGLVDLDYEVPAEVDVPLPLGDLVATLPQVQALDPETDVQLAQKKAQLRRMGAINMEAQQEYEETLERFNYMSAQIEDLREAEEDLRQVIAELDEVTRKEFLRTFEAVAGHFKEIFVRLFGGGSARLLMTDPEDLSETGIDIEARLPGKREQGLALLSGGERSLTAIALVFALLKVSPTPLCVLDEVDAMLDEANVGRFRDLLSELSQETQFIVITHNRNTVQAADTIYGVTMGRDSASQVISLRLDEITEGMLER